MKAFSVGVKDDFYPYVLHEATVFAETSGKAKAERLRTLLDVGYMVQRGDDLYARDIAFTDLTCKSLGDIPVPPTPAELAQREAEAFNRRYPVGTRMHYWSLEKEGDPTGTGKIWHHATVVCDHAVIWIEGARGCHAITHVEVAIQ